MADSTDRDTKAATATARTTSSAADSPDEEYIQRRRVYTAADEAIYPYGVISGNAWRAAMEACKAAEAATAAAKKKAQEEADRVAAELVKPVKKERSW